MCGLGARRQKPEPPRSAFPYTRQVPTPEFVLRLRASIGHEPLWLPGVSAVVTNHHGDLLLGRRADSGEWALISGIVDPGEEPAAAMRREIAEEAGIDAEARALLLVDVTEPITYANHDVSQYLNLTFWFTHLSGDAHVADEESIDVGWFGPDALPDPLGASSRVRIDAFERYRADPGAGTIFHR